MGFLTQHLHVWHLGTALKDLLPEQAIKEKIKLKQYIPSKDSYFLLPKAPLPRACYKKGSPRLRYHFKMLLFISVVVHWVNEFNVTTEIEWLFNRPLVIIYVVKEWMEGFHLTVTEIFIVRVVNYAGWERQTKRYFGEVLYPLKKISTETSQVTWNHVPATVFTVSVLAHLMVLLGGYISCCISF